MACRGDSPSRPYGLHDHLGQFFHKQRHAIGLGNDLLKQLGWQRSLSSNPLNHLRHLSASKTTQCEVTDM